MKITYYCIFIIILFWVLSCTGTNKEPSKSTPTSGTLLIGIDESLKPFADAEISSFTNLYPSAKITPLYLPEKEVVNKLISNDIQTGIICRELYFDEMKTIQDTFVHFPKMIKVATDAIVLVVNSSNKTSHISYNELVMILSGKITNWNQLRYGVKDKKTIVLVTTKASSIDRYTLYLNDSLNLIKGYALDSTAQVIDYIQKNPHSLGILGGSWFYQKGDKYNDIKIVSNLRTSIDGNIESLLYRGVFIITHEPYNGLGNGLIAFIVSEKGQIIVSKAGMVPYRRISREIELSK